MRISTANLDFYDDKGALLREMVTDPNNLPDIVKTASVMDGSEDADLYALVLQEGNKFVKKFPTSDAGNTWLSASYFNANHHKLPQEARSVAAGHIKEACEHYRIPVPSAIESLSIRSQTNIVDVTGKEPSPEIEKVASGRTYALEVNGQGVYPINNAQEVMAASEYFSQNGLKFSPRQRREYSVKVASVANQYDLPVSEAVQKYSGSTLNSDLHGHLLSRMHFLQEEVREDTIEKTASAIELLQKISSISDSLEPDILADTIERFDNHFGLNRYWNRDIEDPYASVFEMSKTAAGFKVEPGTSQVESDSISQRDLEILAKNRGLLIEYFGQSFADSFAKNPQQIFDSMPKPQKKMLARMAKDAVGNI